MSPIGSGYWRWEDLSGCGTSAENGRGLQKKSSLISTYDSPHNGLNFCQDCISETLENPTEEIFDVIRYFGERKKIFNVHFRNIKDGLSNFVEVFPDEGDINMIRTLKVYKDVGYEYMIMPDHVPGIGGPEPRKVGFAYAFGYIHAALQAVEELSQ